MRHITEYIHFFCNLTQPPPCKHEKEDDQAFAISHPPINHSFFRYCSNIYPDIKPLYHKPLAMLSYSMDVMDPAVYSRDLIQSYDNARFYAKVSYSISFCMVTLLFHQFALRRNSFSYPCHTQLIFHQPSASLVSIIL